jgi:hypothetical protein
MKVGYTCVKVMVTSNSFRKLQMLSMKSKFSKRTGYKHMHSLNVSIVRKPTLAVHINHCSNEIIGTRSTYGEKFYA